MEEPIEPIRFDAIVIGTGFQESVVAGALSRAGKKVLHLDCSEFYGSHFGSAELEFFDPWVRSRGSIPPQKRVEDSLTNGFLDPAEPGGAPSEAPHDNAEQLGRLSSNPSGAPTQTGSLVAASGDTTVQTGAILPARSEAEPRSPEGQNGDPGAAGRAERAAAPRNLEPRQEGASPEDAAGVPLPAAPGEGDAGPTGAELASAEGVPAPEEVERAPREEEEPWEPPDVVELPLQSSESGSLYRHMALYDWSGERGRLGNPRKYNIDLCGPRVLHCGGTVVSLLVQSGASSYHEFKAVEVLLTWHAGQGRLVAVPASRAEVFQDRSLSLVEKRHLMRFLKLVADLSPLSHSTPWLESQHDQRNSAAGSADATPEQSAAVGAAQGATAAAAAPDSVVAQESTDQRGSGENSSYASPSQAGGSGPSGMSTPEPQGTPGSGYSGRTAPFSAYRGQTFRSLLETQKLPKAVQEYIMYAVADASCTGRPPATGNDLDAAEGLARMALFFTSVGRYGASSGIIYPSYGFGELPQAFCRIAAVKGALYVLKRNVESLLVDKETGSAQGVSTESGQRLWAPQVLLGASFLPRRTHPLEPQTPGQDGQRTQEEQQGEPGGEGAPGAQPLANEVEGDEGGGLWVARVVGITEESLVEDKDLLLLAVPPEQGGGGAGGGVRRAVRMSQVPATASVCPSGKYLVYASCPAARDELAETLLRPALETLFHLEPASSAQADSAPAHGHTAGAPLTGSGTPRDGASGSAATASTQHAPSPDVPPWGAAGPTKGRATPAEDAAAAEAAEESAVGREATTAEGLGGTAKPRVLWCTFFSQRVQRRSAAQASLPKGVFCASSPDAFDNYEELTEEAQEIFARMAPGEPFYPPTASTEGEEEETEHRAVQSEHEGAEPAVDASGEDLPNGEGPSNGAEKEGSPDQAPEG